MKRVGSAVGRRRAIIQGRRAAGPPVEAIHALLQRWLPGQTIAITRAGSGRSTPVYRVEVATSDDIFYLRLAEEAGEQRRAEVHVHELLRAAGVPVPEIAIWEAEPPELDRSAALTMPVPGTALRDCPALDPSVVDAVARAAGRDLARINRVPVRGFGWVQTVASPDAMLVAEHPTRPAWTGEYARAAAAVARRGILPGPAMDQLHVVLGRWLDRPDQTIGCLAHGDLDATHIYADERAHAYTGIIDFGEIRGADQLYDLGHALLQDHHPDTRSIFPGILAGYREVTPLAEDAVVTIWEEAIAIGTRQLAIFLQRSTAQVPSLTLALEALLETAK